MRYPPRRVRGICRRTLGMGRSAGQTDPIAQASGNSRGVSDSILFPVARAVSKERTACQIDSLTESQRGEWRLSASMEISRAKALARFPGCRAAWEAARGENVLKDEQNRLSDKFLGL